MNRDQTVARRRVGPSGRRCSLHGARPAPGACRADRSGTGGPGRARHAEHAHARPRVSPVADAPGPTDATAPTESPAASPTAVPAAAADGCPPPPCRAPSTRSPARCRPASRRTPTERRLLRGHPAAGIRRGRADGRLLRRPSATGRRGPGHQAPLNDFQNRCGLQVSPARHWSRCRTSERSAPGSRVRIPLAAKGLRSGVQVASCGR